MSTLPVLLLCCLFFSAPSRVDGCETCRQMLFKVFINMFTDENAQFQIDHVSENACLVSDDVEKCISFFSSQWLAIWTSIFQIDNMSLVICANIDAQDNCHEWEAEQLTCQSCQQRISQFARIAEERQVLVELEQYLASDGFCVPYCEEDEQCENRCNYYIFKVFHVALQNLAEVLGQNPKFPCNQAFQLCDQDSN